MYRKSIISIIIFIGIIVVIIGINMSNNYGIKFIINNKTSHTISNLKVSFIKNDISKINLPTINADKSVSYTTTIDNIGENVMVLEYLDNNNKLNTKTISYFENKPSKMKINIIIKSVDTNGVLNIDVNH